MRSSSKQFFLSIYLSLSMNFWGHLRTIHDLWPYEHSSQDSHMLNFDALLRFCLFPRSLWICWWCQMSCTGSLADYTATAFFQLCREHRRIRAMFAKFMKISHESWCPMQAPLTDYNTTACVLPDFDSFISMPAVVDRIHWPTMQQETQIVYLEKYNLGILQVSVWKRGCAVAGMQVHDKR